MAGHVHLVFSRAPEGVTEDEFNAWYDEHLKEILAVPGFRSARRFSLDGVVNAEDGSWTHLALYEIEGEPEDALDKLEQAGMGNAELYKDLKGEDEGFLPLPPWFGDVQFQSWNCYSLDA
jgi:hypothetical protein